MPGHVLGDPVEVLVELPGEPRLADSGDADHRRRVRLPLSAAEAWKSSFSEAQLAVAADEGRLEPLRLQAARPPAVTRSARQSASAPPCP